MYCGKCGSEIDKKTGLCPNCEAAALEKVQEVNTQKSLKKAKRRGVTAIIALILIIAIVVSSVVFAFSKGWIRNNSEEEKKKVQTTYVTYLNKTIIPEIGEYDSNHPESSNEGIHSALFCDLNNDDTDEFVVAYSKKNGSNIEFNISCYEYEEKNTTTDNSSDENIELIGTVNPISEEDYTKDKNAENHMSNEVLVYSVESNEQNYIVVEYLSDTTSSSSAWECHVYTVQNGSFVEVGNLFIRMIAQPVFDAAEPIAVYSTKLPEVLTIDDSDLEFDVVEEMFNFGWEEAYGMLRDDDVTILYYEEAFTDPEYVYNTYYNSYDEAAAAFFEYYGISMANGIISLSSWSDGVLPYPLFWLNYPDDVNLIYSYKYYKDYGDDLTGENYTEKYEINDYTDWKPLIEEYETSDENENSSIEEPDIEKLVSSAVTFTKDFFSSERYDYDKTIKVYNEEMGSNIDCFYMQSDSIKTWEDFCNSSDCYTNDAINEYFSENTITHCDSEDGLYVYWDGLGSTIDTSYIVYTKISDKEYSIKLCSFDSWIGCYVIEKDIGLNYISGKWLFDDVFDYWVWENYSIIGSESEEFNKFDQLYKYNDILAQAYETYHLSEYFEYLLYDMDGNGIYELITHTGESEQDREYNFYSYSDGEVIELGSVSAFHAGLYSDSSSGNLLSKTVYPGEEISYDFLKYTISNNKMNIENISTTESAFDKKYYALEMYDNYYEGNFYATLMN